MAVVYKEGVMLAADSRTTSGAFIHNRVSDKIEPLYNNIFCMRSGNSSHTQAVARYTRYYLEAHSIEKESFPRVLTAATMVRNMIYQNKNFL